jgi:flagellum-specific ATP synthase
MPTHIEADGPNVCLGSLCEVEAEGSRRKFWAEVVRVDRSSLTLTPLEEGCSTYVGALVTALSRASRAPVGNVFLGRAVDALGRPVDGGNVVRARQYRPLHTPALSPLERHSPPTVLETGIRAIDGLLTLGRGQRVGIFAASGVGKTSLLSQIARQVQADITVICLVGERGREVEALWNHGLDAKARSHSTLVAATSDQAASMRVRAGYYALALAEFWRDQGKHVLFLLDSVTRLAMAMREIGLAAGEPPTVRAYTPGVFAAIPKMVERCGASRTAGAITAIMTVLSETDEIEDPICELMKSLLDGHILLSRSMAEMSNFPAIDIARSVSRQAEKLVHPTHRRAAAKVMEWLSNYESSRTLVNAGLYNKGSNPAIDQAMERHPNIRRFLQQDLNEAVLFKNTLDALKRLTEQP